MTLWDKGTQPDAQIEKFTIGKDNELDLQLAKFDVQGSMAHTQMLHSIGILTADENKTLQAGLAAILQDIKADKFTIEQGVEDIHSQVELLLTQRFGDVGKKIHTGRSRNDQVLVDLKLFAKAKIKAVAQQTQTLFDTLIRLSEQHKHTLLPGYTHLQVAMPSSFGLWFAAYAETLIDDVQVLTAAYKIADQNPLGSGAGYGSSFPLNRSETTRLLGFATMHYNVVAAQMSRGKTERALGFAIAGIAATLARFAMDVCLYNSQNFGFIKLPDALTTGSSIMPHKKNPDVMELVRGKCNRLQSLPNEIALLCTNLPSGYHRDFQLLKEILFPAIQELSDCLDITNYMLQHIEISQDVINDERYNYLFTVESVNALVLDGVPFRDAYRCVGEQVQTGQYKPQRTVQHTHEGSIGNLCNAQIVEKMKAAMKIFVICIILFCTCNTVPLLAQDAIKEMERKKQQMEQDISYTNSLLDQTQEKQRTNIDQLNLVKANIDARKSLLKSIDARLAELLKDIDKRQQKTAQLYDNMSQLKDGYAKMLKTAYHSRDSYSQLMYILASEDLNQAYRRITYLKSFSDALLKQARDISEQSEQLNIEITRLQKAKVEQESLQGQKTQEVAQLNSEVKNYERIVSVLKRQEQSLRYDLEQKKQQAALMNRQIESAIAEEARKEAERRKREQERLERLERERLAAELKKNKGKAKTPPTPLPSTIFDSRFEKLKGQLKMPVNQGTIVTRFGVYNHPVLPDIRVTSNGIDISTNVGAIVNVVADGIVRKIFSTGSVTSILIQHDLYYTVYTHLTNIKVEAGDMVRAHQPIGLVEPVDNRAILHFELWKQTEKQDPEAWLVKK